jgi:hypothetical protein
MFDLTSDYICMAAAFSFGVELCGRAACSTMCMITGSLDHRDGFSYVLDRIAITVSRMISPALDQLTG